mmetsp:Transcript_10863/g.24654  ORF Transcript_10863/g.24654 Transcript_10863/m.24654 type:complete len:250 (+) Transcript_10863:1299-2048(+)
MEDKFRQRPPCAFTSWSTFKRASHASAEVKPCKALLARSSMTDFVSSSSSSANLLTSSRVTFSFSISCPFGSKSPAETSTSKGFSSPAAVILVRTVAWGNMACKVDAMDPESPWLSSSLPFGVVFSLPCTKWFGSLLRFAVLTGVSLVLVGGVDVLKSLPSSAKLSASSARSPFNFLIFASKLEGSAPFNAPLTLPLTVVTLPFTILFMPFRTPLTPFAPFTFDMPFRFGMLPFSVKSALSHATLKLLA